MSERIFPDKLKDLKLYSISHISAVCQSEDYLGLEINGIVLAKFIISTSSRHVSDTDRTCGLDPLCPLFHVCDIFGPQGNCTRCNS